ncbi:MAG: MFS transporter [Thermomicrobiales bacterium]|nr:MFS transporter [Thermomicrobiales bacterium]
MTAIDHSPTVSTVTVDPTETEAIQSIQRRLVNVMAGAQMLGGVGVATGATVGALLAADLSNESVSGLSATASVVGAALAAIPISRVMNVRGRRAGLMVGYGIGVGGALTVIIGASLGLFPLALLGLVGIGAGTAAGLQSRYAATDLATPQHRGRALSTVVWATTVGSVLGPNLSSPMGRVAETIGIPKLTGPYLLTMVALLTALLVIWLFLRPDPLLTARELRVTDGAATAVPILQRSIKESLSFIRSIPAAAVGLAAMCIGQAVMSAVMSMTPIHLKHGDADLRIIGFVISGHIAGMYAASPLVGMASDRFGRRPVILAGCAILLASFVVAGTAGEHGRWQLGAGLFLLGLGWSCTLIAGSTLLTESIPLDARPTTQGAADLTMGMSGAAGALLAGLIVAFGSYGLLNLLAALLVIPLAAAVLRRAVAPLPASS